MPCSGCSALYRVNLNNKKTASSSAEISDDPWMSIVTADEFSASSHSLANYLSDFITCFNPIKWL